MPIKERAVPLDAVNDVSFKAPHLWILGAGASRQAFPQGDAAGNRLPLMNDLVEILGLADLLEEHGVEFLDRNFEVIFEDLLADATQHGLCREIESAINEYFSSLVLPDEPCLYDYLVWSLRSKDTIATFNWDPFLWQACMRAAKYFEPPMPMFLHGSVAVGYCLEDKLKGPADGTCRGCRRIIESSRLLYPVSQKDYASDPHIAGEWLGERWTPDFGQLAKVAPTIRG